MPKPLMFPSLRPFFVSFACWALLLEPVGSVGAQMQDPKLEKLAQEIQQALESDKRPAPPPTIGDNGRMLLGNLRGGMSRGDLAQVESALAQLAVYLHSEPLRARCEAAAREIRILREAKEKEATEEIAALFKRAADVVRSAKNPSDLDGLLQELGKWRAPRADRPVSSSSGDNSYRIEPAIQFITYWQNFLAQNAANDAKAAQATLDHIIGLGQGALLPRSEILSRRYGPPPTPAPTTSATPRPPGEDFADTLEELKTPEDLVPVMLKLVEWANDSKRISSAELPSLQHTISALTVMVGAYQDFQAGLPIKLESVLTDPTRNEPLGVMLAPVRGKLIKLILPRYMGVAPAMKVNPDEGVQEFLERVVAEAVNRGDYGLATRARQTQKLLRDGKTEVPTKENSQSDLYVTAHNQELAGQFALAVTSYQKVLASGTDIIPAKVIGERLASIKAEHPKEFEEGLQAYLTPRFPTPPPGWENMIGGFGPSGPRPPPGPPRRPPSPAASATPSGPFISPVPQKTQPPS